MGERSECDELRQLLRNIVSADTSAESADIDHRHGGRTSIVDVEIAYEKFREEINRARLYLAKRA